MTAPRSVWEKLDVHREADIAAYRREQAARLEQVVPPRFRPLVPIPPDVLAWCETVGTGACSVLLLVGPVGTGKTHLAWQVARHLAPQVGRTVVQTADQFAAGARGDGSAQTAGAYLEHLSRASLLVLDDLGAQTLTAWVSDAVFRVVDARYQHLLPMVLTSNVPDLRSLLGERTASRLAEQLHVVPVVGPDRRRA